jgi:hypothetical protein
MKALDAHVFDPAKSRTELDEFKALLDAHPALAERDHLMPLFKWCRHLTALIGTQIPGIGTPDRVASEFQVFGDYAADLVIGNSDLAVFCAIELEDAGPDSIFHRAGAKATPEWGRRFEHGFSQLVDWFYAWDDYRGTAGFAKHFGHGKVEFYGVLLIGRSADLSPADRDRLHWRSQRVSVNTHKVFCWTYDDLYTLLDRDWRMLAEAKPTVLKPAAAKPAKGGVGKKK